MGTFGRGSPAAARDRERSANMEKGKKEQKAKMRQSSDQFKKAQHLFKNKEYKEAIETFSLAISLRPDNARYYFQRGNCFRAMGAYQRCLFDYSMAIRIDNDSAVFYGNRGVCYRKLGRVSEAIRDYSRAVELEPENTVFHYNRAVAYCDQLDYEQAIEDYTAAIQRESRNFRAIYNRGNCFRKVGRLEDSAADCGWQSSFSQTKPTRTITWDFHYSNWLNSKRRQRSSPRPFLSMQKILHISTTVD